MMYSKSLIHVHGMDNAMNGCMQGLHIIIEWHIISLLCRGHLVWLESKITMIIYMFRYIKCACPHD